MRPRIVLFALALAAVGCSRGGSDDAFEWTDEVPAGSVVHIRDGAGNIRISRAAGQTAVVRGSRTWRRSRARDVKFVVEQHDNEYYVCAMWRNSGKCATNGYRGRNTGGFLSMFSLFHRNSDATADFVVELPANVVVDASTNTGSVQVDGLAAGVRARAVNGTIRATNVSGSLSLATTNGDVRLSADSLAITDSVQLSTTNGSVHAELPPGLQGMFDLSVVNGNVRSDLPLPPGPADRIGRHVTGQIGTATRPVKMRTINGSVEVTARPVPASISGNH